MSTADAIVNFIQRFSWVLVALILIFGWTSPVLMLLAFICMLAPVIFSFSYGRAWCGNFCPRGSFSGSVLTIISPNKPIPKLLKSNWFRLLMLVLIMMLFIYNLSKPHSSLTCLGTTFIKMMAVTTLAQIIFAILIHPFAWCTFCPMGTISSWIAKRKSGVKDYIKINDKCISCRVCTQNCPAQIDIPSWSTKGAIIDTDCMKCRKCIKCCHQKCIEYN